MKGEVVAVGVVENENGVAAVDFDGSACKGFGPKPKPELAGDVL